MADIVRFGGFVAGWCGLLVVVTLACPSMAFGADDVRTLLLRQTQELYDAVTAGDSTVWDRYLDPDVVYVDEGGSINGKADLVDGIKPLPKEIWGELKVADFDVRAHGDIAVTTHRVEETEGYFGQVIHARYLTSHTWRRGPRGWRLISAHTQALRQDPPAVALAPGRLDEYAGVYSLTPDVTYTIRREREALTGQRSGRKAEPLKAEAADVMFVPGQPRLRKVFQRGPDGRITGFIERRETWDIVWKRSP